jgi:hypothetical protein
MIANPDTDQDGRPCLMPGYNLSEADWKEIWKVRDEIHRVEGAINLSELSVRYSADGKRWYLVRAKYAIENLAAEVKPSLREGDEIILSESTETPYTYMLFAWQILLIGQSAKWKTVEMLRTLRQAIREVTAQMMPVELPRAGASRREVQKFLTVTRYLDGIHHGQPTF